MMIGEAAVCLMAAFWHSCHRGIYESFHIRCGDPVSKDGLEQHPCLMASSPFMALVHQLRNPRFLSQCSELIPWQACASGY